MITQIADVFTNTASIVVTDSWFGNNGLWKPLNEKLGQRIHMISRLRSNNNVFELPDAYPQKGPGRPRKYGKKLVNTSSLTYSYKHRVQEFRVNLYGRVRTVVVYDRVVMLKSLKCSVRVVWIYRKTRWFALFSTDLTLSVPEIIEYYGARWKIEATFKELKQDVGSADIQTRNANAVNNHLHFCMMATTVTWIYASRLDKTPSRRHLVKGRNDFAFSDVRRLIANASTEGNFHLVCPETCKFKLNPLISVLLRIAA